MKWFRLYNEIIDDPKMLEITDKEFRHFIFLMCLASEREKEGLIDLSIEKISWRLRLSLEEAGQIIDKLKSLKILSQNGDGFQFLNWEKRQYRSDNVNERVKKFRQKKKGENETLHETLHETDQRQRQRQSNNNLTVICPQKEIVDLYHETLPELPKVKIWNEKRQGYLRTRWKEDPERQSMDWWKRFFEYVRKCAHLMGHNNRQWTANLEWLIKAENFVKVIEGNYEDK